MFDKAKILFTGSNWQDQTATWRKLFEQRRRHVSSGGSHYDTVKWPGLGQTKLAISVFQANIELLQSPHIGLGFFEQWPQAFDGVNILGQLGEYGSLITATGANLQSFTQ